MKCLDVQTATPVIVAHLHVVRTGNGGLKRQFDGNDLPDMETAGSLSESNRQRNTALILTKQRWREDKGRKDQSQAFHTNTPTVMPSVWNGMVSSSDVARQLPGCKPT